MKYLTLSAILVLSIISSITFSQSIVISSAEVIYDDNNNGYIEPTEEVALNYTIFNNSNVNYSNILIEENFTQYNADLLTLDYIPTSLMAGDSFDVQITYQMAEYLMPWELEASLRFIDNELSDTLILDYLIPVEFNFDCSEIEVLSLNVYTDSLYPNVVLELENTSLWSLQYPGFLFEVSDPYFSFSGQIGYYYVFPSGWSYEFWESITVDPNIPENYQIDAIVTLITLDSLVICEFPISFMVNETSSDISSISVNENYIYPNPVSESLSLNLSYSGEMIYNILNVEGKTIISDDVSNIETTIDTNSLKPGLYFIEVVDKNLSNVVFREKFIRL